jgi:glycolate oxidase FAD binding subunit
VERVRAAMSSKTPLRIVGGDTKCFYGRPVAGDTLALAGHHGVLRYDPAELVITARGGTLLADIEALLARHGQQLPFEPPSFGPLATLGGTVAAGLAGPARIARGPVRDYVLGTRLLTGDGRVLKFGGEVMKNVAGYDVSGQSCGASTRRMPSACSAQPCNAASRSPAVSGAPVSCTCAWKVPRPGWMKSCRRSTEN